MPAKAADSLPVQVRLPRALHEELVAAAERHYRSLNGEIVAMIMLGQRVEAEMDAEVERQMPVLGPRVAQAIRDQNAAARERRTAKR